ncbi:MAG: LysR family transcriptional regulator [Comamonadaceae bacterium]|nr:MAG: LysR family transcriptional regulator [Comamonadaceae bacterium]
MDHKWLEDFVVLARERNFSRAAQMRHVTQPQFSRRIRQLEIWAGADLINRAVVPLELTPAGEELLPTAHRSVTGIGDARARIRHLRGANEWITLATGRTLSRTVVAPWLARLRRDIAGLRVRISTGSISEGVAALEHGSADFLLSFTHPRLPLMLAQDRFDAMTFSTDVLVAVSAPRAHQKAMHLLPGTERQPVPFLAYAPTLALGQVLQDALSRRNDTVYLDPIVESDFAESLHEQALQGAGVAWLPRRLVEADLQTGRLVHADAPDKAIGFEIRLHRARQARNAMIQRMWDASQIA